MNQDTGLAIVGGVVLAAAVYGVYRFFAGPSKAEVQKANEEALKDIFKNFEEEMAQSVKDAFKGV